MEFSATTRVLQSPLSNDTIKYVARLLLNLLFFVRVGDSSSAVVALSSGVPQGSVLGPILFTAYVVPIGKLIESFGVKYHKYADDNQLCTSLTTSPDTTVDLLESCSSALHQWFRQNDLLLNRDKSEVCIFGTRQKLRHVTKPTSIDVTGCCVEVCEKLKTLGVTLDNKLTFEADTNGVVRS